MSANAPRTLASVDVSPAEGVFRLRLVTADGETIDLGASRDQLDHLADLLDDALLSEGAEEEGRRPA